MQQHHLRQHCVFDREYDANQRRHDARNSAYAQPANGDQLERRVSMIVHAANAKARERGGGECRWTLALSPFIHQRRVAFADASSHQQPTAGLTIEIGS